MEQKPVIDKVNLDVKFENYNEALKYLESQDVIHLGWVNSGVQIPEHMKFEKVFSNWSGSSCLYCDPIYRVSYSVDMGD
jgi:hypothetical protein